MSIDSSRIIHTFLVIEDTGSFYMTSRFDTFEEAVESIDAQYASDTSHTFSIVPGFHISLPSV